MSLKCDYKNRTCDISMPSYVSNVLSRLQHDAPKHPQHTPSRYVTPVYGAKTQYATKDKTLPLMAKQCLTIKKVSGPVLYYARAVNPTVLMPLTDIVTEQTKANGKNTGRHESIVRLFGDATRRHHQVSCFIHDTTNTQRYLYPFSLKYTQPSRRPVFLWGQIPATRYAEWLHP
jgi:hypothetical protein